MHPDVESPQPADWPQCGMSLEPVVPVIPAERWTCPMHPEIVRDAPDRRGGDGSR